MPNLGRPGVVAGAISALDIALWDLKARLLGLALCDLLGRCRDTVPVYGRRGSTTYDEATATRQLERWTTALGIGAVKIKVGESWGTNVARDLERTAYARRVVGDRVDLFVDANGGVQPQAGGARRVPSVRKVRGELVRRAGLLRGPRRPP
jgi:L-alanine-DL-glutamate epimerase-like enolase superfamily enzyme